MTTIETNVQAPKTHAIHAGAEDIIERYVWLVGWIGAGFHPDTAGEDYESLPKNVVPHVVNMRLELMHNLCEEQGTDIYELTLVIMRRLGIVTT
jgi:hypothetical protein